MNQVSPDKPLSNLKEQSRLSVGSPTITEFPVFPILKCQQNLVIVKSDRDNKAEKTLRYWLDVPAAKVLMHDLWDGALATAFNEFKRRGNAQRALKVEPLGGGAYKLSIMNDENGEKRWLFFELSRFQVRCLSRTVLDHLQACEFASMFAAYTSS